MKFDNNLPIYLQIMDYIKVQIISAEIKEGEKLPSVRELSAKLKVNPNTIQRSYQELERENLVESKRGMGTFVTDNGKIIKSLKIDMARKLSSKFIEDMKSIGFSREEILETIRKI